jgi:hypothetical protein
MRGMLWFKNSQAGAWPKSVLRGFRLFLSLPVLASCSAVDSFLSEGGDLPSLKSCPSTVTVQLKASEPTFKLSYTEPQVAAGAPDLAKTTVYVDLGDGPSSVREIAATSPRGGGAVTESIAVPWAQDDGTATVCVTATDVTGRESLPNQ